MGRACTDGVAGRTGASPFGCGAAGWRRAPLGVIWPRQNRGLAGVSIRHEPDHRPAERDRAIEAL